MNVTGRQHNADDLIATVLAVEPMKFIYRGRIAVFSVPVLRDERICIIAEQKPDVSEEEVSRENYPNQFTVNAKHHQGSFRLKSTSYVMGNFVSA